MTRSSSGLVNIGNLAQLPDHIVFLNISLLRTIFATRENTVTKFSMIISAVVGALWFLAQIA
jgi:hypothetical protein